MRTRVAVVVAIFAVATAIGDEKKPSIDVAKLDGNWNIASGTKNGTKISEMATKTVVKIAKDKLSMGDGDMKFEFKFTIDAKVDPATIDLEMTASPFGAGMKAKGIISVEKDELKLCYSQEDRPKKFDGEKAFLFVLKRKTD